MKKIFLKKKCWFTKIGQGSFWICDVYIVLWWCCLGSLYGRWHCLSGVFDFFFFENMFVRILILYVFIHLSLLSSVMCWEMLDELW